MPILGAFGLGLTIFVLQSMVPEIFSQIEITILALLHGAQVSLHAATMIAGAAESIAPH